MYPIRDPTLLRNGAENIFIKNLDKGIDQKKALRGTFSAFGNISSCKLALDPSSKSKGYGFVQFDNEESAKKEIEQLNGMLLNQVDYFICKQERDTSSGKTNFNNVFIKNFSESATDEDLKKIFDGFGPITSVVVIKDANANSNELQIYQRTTRIVVLPSGINLMKKNGSLKNLKGRWNRNNNSSRQ
ncbi:hypothetical protein GQ457_11G001280 [Hibiscus cannabinus]